MYQYQTCKIYLTKILRKFLSKIYDRKKKPGIIQEVKRRKQFEIDIAFGVGGTNILQSGISREHTPNQTIRSVRILSMLNYGERGNLATDKRIDG